MHPTHDDASHLLMADDPCTECEGTCRVTIGIEPITYSGSGDSPRFRDVKGWCPRCEGSGIEPKHYCGECADVRVPRAGDQCAPCRLAEVQP